MIFKPMLAANDKVLSPTLEDLQQLQYPMYGTPKKDGIRARVVWQDGKHRLLSRTNKPIPNCMIEEWCEENEIPIGCDGELVVQDRFGDADFHECQSKIMTKYSAPFNWTYYVFDMCRQPNEPPMTYKERFRDIHRQLRSSAYPKVVALSPQRMDNPGHALAYALDQIDIEGNEGIILRRGDGPYKQGRTTFNEGYMLKVKECEDREAIIIGFEERMHNANKGKRDGVGALKRSKHKANLHKTGMLGAFWVRDIETNVEFKVSGFTDAFARKAWENQHLYYNKVCTYSKFKHGEKDKPRQPKFKGIRDERDL